MQLKTPTRLIADQPLPLLGAGVGEEAELVGAGVVDEDVERAADRLDRRSRRVEAGDVELERVAVGLARDPLGAGDVDVADPDLGALGGQARRDRGADAARAAGDQRLPSLQSHRAEHRLTSLERGATKRPYLVSSRGSEA